jgi:hypothetical protein
MALHVCVCVCACNGLQLHLKRIVLDKSNGFTCVCVRACNGLQLHLKE